MKKYDIGFVRGDDYTLKATLNPPQDLIGCRLDLHAQYEDNIVLQLSTEDGSIDVKDGAIFLHFSHEVTKHADWDSAEYDLQLIDAQHKRRTLMRGRIKLLADITRI